MKMLVTAVGTVEPPIRIDRGRKRATFTLKVDDDRFFISTVGLDQYERMKENADQKMNILVMGYAFSYRSNKCGNHHVGVEPLLLVEFNDYTDLIDMQDIFSQWFLTSLLNMGGLTVNRNGDTIHTTTEQSPA